MGANRLRIYICGPISKGDMLHNVRQADAAFFALLKAGLAPFNPMCSVFAGSAVPAPVYSKNGVIAHADATPRGTTHADWMGADLPWVEVADAVLRLPGESVGAEMETAFAMDCLIPVFHSAEELIAWASERGAV